MARADLLKKLLDAYVSHDDAGFRNAADQIIAEERRLGHHVVAEDLKSILVRRNGSPRKPSLMALPQKERGQGDLLIFRDPLVSFEDLILADETKSRLCRVIDELRHHRELARANLRPARKLLFYGPPGCGKTITAEAMAREIGLPFVNARVDSIVSSFLGETSANMRRAFDFASAHPCVILFDEFDSIGKSRDDPHELGELKRVVNSFLQMLDAFNGDGLVIAATNHEQLLDSALWRRFDEVIRFPMPTRSDKVQLIRLLLRGVAKTDVTPSKLAQAFRGFSHAAITTVIRDALKHVVLSGTNCISESTILEAARRYRARLRSNH